MSNPGEENPPPNQQNPQPDDEATSRPRRRARAPHNTQLALAVGPRALARRPMQISLEHLQGALGPAPQQVPQLRRRAPSRALLLPPELGLSYDWICAICRDGFLSAKALGGHMGIHKDRNWKGIHPPPELCKPQGLGGLTVGGGGEGILHNIVHSVPSHPPGYQEVLGTGGDDSKQGGESLGKRPVWAKGEERSDETLRRLKRNRLEEVPDLNVTPPQPDEQGLEDQARADGLHVENVTVVEKEENSSAPRAEFEAIKEAREDAPQVPEALVEAREDAPQAMLGVIQEEREDALQVEPEAVVEESIEGDNAPHDESVHEEPEPKEEGKEECNGPDNKPETNEEAKEEGSNAQCDGVEKETGQGDDE